jgi:DNA excision repair protein ERCC-4
LEADWHRTAPRTKQLVSDLGVLRKLLDYLIRYDAFSFYYVLMKLQAASATPDQAAAPSQWLVLVLS